MRIVIAGCMAACALAGGHAAAAETWPSRPIHLIVPFPPGSGTDIFGRVIAAKLTEKLGKQVVVDNRGGAAGVIGTEIAVNSQPDGYTLLVISVPHVYMAAMRKVPYDPIRSITPVALMGTGTNALAVHPSVPVTSVKALIALAKARPGQLNYASAGTGSFSHLSGELFRSLAGIDVVHVPFKGGGPAMIAMVAGQSQFIIGSLLQTLPYVQSGKLRALGVGSLKRSPAAPDVPTIAESGVPGYEAANWWGIVGPARMPQAVVKRVHADTAAILQSPETRKWFAQEGADVSDMTTGEFEKWIVAETAKWSRVVKEAGIRDE